MSGDCVMVPEIFRDLLERVEMLASEAGNLGRSNGVLREELEASKKECQELRDALAEAVQEVGERRTEQLANRSHHIIDATILANMLDQAGVPKPIGDASVTNRVRYLLDFYLDII